MSRRDMPNLTQANTTLSARDAAFRQRQVFKSGIRRIHADLMPFYRAMAVVQVALLHADEQTNAAYSKVCDSLGLPDCQQVIEDALASGRMSSVEVVKMPSDIDPKYADNPDWLTLYGYIVEFFKLAFNRKNDQEDETWKILPNRPESIVLYLAVFTWAVGEYLKVNMAEWTKYRDIEYGGKLRDSESIMQNDPNGRLHRLFTQWLKASFVKSPLFHEEKLLSDADIFYKCCVQFDSIEAYLTSMAEAGYKIDTTKFDSKQQRMFDAKYYPYRNNITPTLAPFKDATGYRD